jgi:hypothetical protein
MLQGSSRLPIAALLLTLVVTSVPAITEKHKKDKVPKGTPVLWRRVDIRSKDLLLGPGAAAMKPDLRRITFIEEQKGGYSKKYKVRDASGREWSAKIGKEAQSETAAVRFLWALGYVTEINYLAPTATIEGIGTFHNVRFEARPENVKRMDEWKWSDNPFLNTREFRGLKVLMAFINNWDIKDSNNEILQVRTDRGNELRYVISDLGATFGQSGSAPIVWRITRSRNNPKKYANAEFVDVIVDNNVYFHYGGKRGSLFGDITVDDAEWIGGLLSQLSTRQIRDAFRAANYTPAEIELLTNEVKERTSELVRLRSDQRIGKKQ